jgi:hypothetical protein
MTGVFSGGLAYEYSLEKNGFGVVEIKTNGSITELEGFSLLANALKNVSIPEGNGNYKEVSSVSECPKPGKWWLPKNISLPRIPGIAASYFDNGAGTPKGIQGTPKCSHWCGKNSTGLENEDGSDGSGGSKKAAKNKGAQVDSIWWTGLPLIVMQIMAMVLL